MVLSLKLKHFWRCQVELNCTLHPNAFFLFKCPLNCFLFLNFAFSNNRIGGWKLKKEEEEEENKEAEERKKYKVMIEVSKYIHN